MSIENKNPLEITNKEGERIVISERPDDMDETLKQRMQKDFEVSQKLVGNKPHQEKPEEKKVAEPIPKILKFPADESEKKPRKGAA